MTKRGASRLIGVCLCAVALMGAFAVYQFNEVRNYQRELNHVYSRAFYDMLDYVKNIDASLEKGIHVSSPGRLIDLSGEIRMESGGAISALGQLPLGDTSTANLAKFLTQVGDYANTLSKKAVYDEEITDEELLRLEELSTYAKKLTKSLLELERSVADGSMAFMSTGFPGGGQPQAFSETMGNAEESFAEYPTLLYDGPFSDAVEKKDPVLLDGKEEVTMEEGTKTAANMMGVDPSQVTGAEGSSGTVKTYNYTTAGDDVTICAEVTRAGGFPFYYLNGRKVGEAKLSHEEGVDKAEAYLEKLGFKNMKKSYFIESGGVLTVNFAYVDGDYICYSDLVEVGIALDDGEPVMLLSRGYVMNHKDRRDIPEIIVPREEAVKGLNSRLKEENYELAIIPTKGGGEKPVHGFLCSNKDGRKYLVYFSTQNGREEDMMMLIEGDEGTLTM